MDISKAAGIMKLWGEIPVQVAQIRDVTKVITDRGERCLKKVKDIDRVLFMLDVMNYVQERGFKRLAPCLPSQNSQMVEQYGGSYYVVQEWLDGRELDYANLDDMVFAGETLGLFHRASEGFISRKGYRAKNKLGTWPGKMENRLKDLELYLNIAKRSNPPSPFEKKLIFSADWLSKHARESIKRLKGSKYGELVKEAEKKGFLVHGDAAARNFVFFNGTVCLIDFDAVAKDICLVDLWRLLRRTLWRGHWELKIVNKIINSYKEVMPLDFRHREVLAAFLEFPEKPWKITRQYYEKRESKNWNEELLTEELESYLTQNKKFDRFIKKFRKSYGHRCRR